MQFRSVALMWAILATSLAAAASTANASGQGRSPPDFELPIEGRQITNPDWVEKPTADELSSVYPQIAQMLGLNGRAKLDCSVTVRGSLEDCKVSGELPKGIGFGEAALQLVPSFLMRPQTVEGSPVGGARVYIPIHFVWPADDTPNPADPEPSAASPPSSEALGLATKLSAATHADRQFQEALDQYSNQLRTLGAEVPQSDEGRKALASLVDAAQSLGQKALKEQRDQFARDLSVPQMRELIAFLESPTGQAWLLALDRIEAAELRRMGAISQTTMADARARFCHAVECADQPAKK